MKVCDGTLGTFMADTEGSGDFSKVMTLVFDIAKGLHHMHQHHIVHRDLHRENVFIREGTAIISDFNTSKQIHASQAKHTRCVGWMAVAPPEVNKTTTAQVKYTVKYDIWSFGVLLIQMVSAMAIPDKKSRYKWPVDSYSQVKRAKEHALLMCQQYGDDSKILKWMIRGTLNEKPESRPSASVIAARLEQHLSKK